jgi:hypothetical protein
MNIDEHNFVLFAARHYDNPGCYDTEEFLDDVKRFKYLRRLFRSYREGEDLKVRLILNHITIIYNVFGAGASTMLFFKLWEYRAELRPFIDYLGLLPDTVGGIGIDGRSLDTINMESDAAVAEALRTV